MDDEDLEDSQHWRGNVRRRMWKTVCHRAALNVRCPLRFFTSPHLHGVRIQPTLSAAERALYAALAPTPATSTALKSHCRTWEDHLWALVSVACEERLSAGLANIERECFWEGGLGALESGVTAGVDGRPRDAGEEDEWEEEVMQTLQALSSVQVAEG